MNSIEINGKGKSVEIIIDGDSSSSIHPASLNASKLNESSIMVRSSNPATMSFFIDDISILTVDGATFTDSGEAAAAINELANFNKGGTSSSNNGGGSVPVIDLENYEDLVPVPIEGDESEDNYTITMPKDGYLFVAPQEIEVIKIDNIPIPIISNFYPFPMFIRQGMVLDTGRYFLHTNNYFLFDVKFI